MDTFYKLIDANTQSITAIAPEVMVAATFLMAMIFDFSLSHHHRQGTGWLCVTGLAMALWLNGKQNYMFLTHAGAQPSHDAFAGMIAFDFYGSAFKSILLLGTIVAVIMAIHAKELHGRNHGEFYLLLVSVCLGGMFLCSATNLLMIYLSLEALSVVSYAMAGYLRRDRKSAEAGIKYVIYGAMASGIMIFGMSYLYGITGTLSRYNVNGADGVGQVVSVFKAGGVSTAGLAVVLAMVFSGFLYKIAAAPFHYWSPDVYEGSPTTAAGFFSVVPKAAGFAALIRAAFAFFPPGTGDTTAMAGGTGPSVESVVMTLSVVTMLIGNLAALAQTNVKRMLAYSSIAHAGYMLAGLTVLNTFQGPAPILFYLGAYLLMNLGAFMVLLAMENIFGGTDLRHLRGAIRREPVLGTTLCVFLFSLTGLPPLAGFMGKWFIMVELARNRHYGMIVWIGINSVISLYYYMRIAKAVAIDEPDEGNEPRGRTPFAYNFLAVAKSIALLLLFVYSEPVMKVCRDAFERLKT
jgi:NADH-quinone oxidoreductase subunit N